jgi:hypothetical protein
LQPLCRARDLTSRKLPMTRIPFDVWLAMALMVLISTSVGLITGHLLRGKSKGVASVVATGAVVLVLVHGLFSSKSLSITRVLPTANAVIYGNIALPAVAVMLAVIWHTVKGTSRQRLLLISVIGLLALRALYAPLHGNAPAVGPPRWVDGICRQTTATTCSAASAATVLTGHGVQASETEMARLCLTGDEGTSALGLYRGLKLKLHGTGLEPRAVFGVEELRGAPKPAVVLFDDVSKPKTLGMRGKHAVGLTAIDGNAVTIADPADGLRVMTLADFEQLWTGEAVAIVGRE